MYTVCTYLSNLTQHAAQWSEYPHQGWEKLEGGGYSLVGSNPRLENGKL